MSSRDQSQRAFGDWLRQRRRELDLTREELARQVGCSVVTLQKLETEERRPSKAMAERLAEVLSVPAVDRLAFLRFARGDPFAAPGQPQPVNGVEGQQARRNNLPIQLTSFIGREKQIEEIRRLLGTDLTPPAPLPAKGRGEAQAGRDDEKVGVRLLTLTGVGGAGKTRLALQAAAGLLEQFPGGVWLVELAPLTDPLLVPETVAGVLAIREQAGRPIRATLTDHFRDHTVLLVVDNCEHLVAACAQFAAALLQDCPNLRLLVTSREALGIPGERLFVVPPLLSPDTRHPLSVDGLMHYDSVRLFVERASAVLPGFAVTKDNASAVTEICCQLDGIPLAIELAAARVKVLGVEQIAERIDDRFRLLTGGSRVARPRHQTLQALIDWSYDLLSEPERILLRRLAVFVGGWTLGAAEETCADGDDGGRPKDQAIHPADVLELLSQLVSKSLVVVERQPRQEARYRLLETIREYALAKLGASGEADAVCQRLAEHFVERVKTFQLSDPLGGVLAYDRRLDPELDNLRAVLAWSQSATGSEELGLRLAGGVIGLWRVRGHWNEAGGLLEAALRRAPPTADARARARALLGLGTLAYFRGDYAVASVYLLDSLDLSRALNDRLATGATLTTLGEAALEQGDAAALRRFQESLALFRELGNKEGIAWALNDLGDVAVMQEDVARARALLEESLALGRLLSSALNIAWALNGLGHTAQLVGDFAGAWQLHSESLELYREYTEPNEFIPWAFQSLGETALAQGDVVLASQHFLQALRLFRDEGDRGAISYCLAGLAGVAVLDEEPRRAARLWGAAESLRQAIGARQAPATRATRQRLMAAAQQQLGDEVFAAAWAEGATLTLEQAIALALGDQ